jgi:DNA recombination protein RmuC
VIIDSKVSLVAYERYVNAEQPEEKERALQEHIKSVRQHVTELSRKDYSKYIKAPRESVDFVIMFVPFESSLQLALLNDPTLWRDAFERKVFITGEQNLLGILHMIHIAWVQNQQAENQEKVFGIAEQLLDRLGDFVQRYNKVGEQIEQARKDAEKFIGVFRHCNRCRADAVGVPGKSEFSKEVYNQVFAANDTFSHA